ncbi:AAA family ATPase [Inquilinus limosus]|uniref:ATP-dependent nuclease n=1 Tax=Inquilinus limosus TaxID=171674 RepID=UPI003F16CDA6
MRLENITLSGFRCFGPEPITFAVAPDITAVVGPNAAGKTALLQGLSKLFGVTRAQRTVQRLDFHMAPDGDPDDRSPKTLFIDVLVVLPELADGSATPETVAPSLRHMLLTREERPPVCRLRLEARWEDDGTVEGEVSQELYWVDSLALNPPADKKKAVPPADRGLIQLYYTPASRDAAAQVRATTGALAARLLRAIEWSEATQNAITAASKSLTQAFERETAIEAIAQALQTRWGTLHDDSVDTKPRLSLVNRHFEEVVGKIAVIFEQGPDGRERGIEALSDGQQSLFYFALAAAVFDMERKVVAGGVDGFHDDRLRIPALSLFALEEPENHLSPYFLSRVVRQVRSFTTDGGAQAIITSHSPAVLSRVKPREVRYCRCDPQTRISSIKPIKIPPGSSEAAKFVRGAMLAYPELYFARFVLLVEGDSERILLPRLAEALNLLVDPAFVAIVPLGGRHVQHFWRLLSDLEIPYATLLDLDLGREGGGFGRVKTTIENLIGIGRPKAELLETDDGVLSDESFAQMHTWQDAKDLEILPGWVNFLKSEGVFFSEPLDIDLAMLKAFPEAYAAAIASGGGPRMTVEKAAEAVLGTGGSGLKLYTGALEDYPDLLPAYRYHFLTRSKPATHLAALAHISTKELRTKMPPVLAEVLAHVAKSVRRD